MPRYLITKAFEPEGVYAASLEQLPGDEEDLTPDLPVIVKLREMTEDEARMVAARQHIAHVEEDGTMSIPEPVEAEAVNMSPAQARAFHGIDEAHRRGIRGGGQKIAVVDTGCGQVYADGLGRQAADKVSFVPGETWVSDDDTHGEWCLSTVANCCPDASFGILKVLSNTNGSGQYSWIISGVNYAVSHGYTGITLSLGGGASASVDAAVNAAEDAGLHVTVAAGNEQRGKTGMTADSTSPARAAKVLTVAAVDSDGTVADFSNWGTCVDLACLGYAVAADYVSGFWNGTSMATPYAQAGVALVRSAGASKDVAKQAIIATARNTAAEPFKEGSGVMRVAAALDSLKPTPAPIPSTISWSRFVEEPKVTLKGSDVDITLRGAPFGHFRGVEAK